MDPHLVAMLHLLSETSIHFVPPTSGLPFPGHQLHPGALPFDQHTHAFQQ